MSDLILLKGRWRYISILQAYYDNHYKNNPKKTKKEEKMDKREDKVDPKAKVPYLNPTISIIKCKWSKALFKCKDGQI